MKNPFIYGLVIVNNLLLKQKNMLKRDSMIYIVKLISN